MAHTFTNLITHAVFSTKDRLPPIDGELQQRLFPYLGGIVRELGGKALAINGMGDHVHLLLVLSAEHSVAEAMRTVKANSSRWIHQTWPARSRFAWQRGYGAFSVSRSNVPAVARYIEEQQKHHRRLSTEEESILLLEKHGVEYDPRWLWK